MTLGRYAESIVLSGIVIISLGVAAVSLRRRSLPTWSGAPARLVEMIIAISLVVVVSQTLGTIGFFRVGPLVTTLVLVALLTVWIGKNGGQWHQVVDCGGRTIARRLTHPPRSRVGAGRCHRGRQSRRRRVERWNASRLAGWCKRD